MVRIAACAPLPAITGWIAAAPVVVVLGFSLMLWSFAPAGYVGGGGDEWHYLQAARCLAEHGWCIPTEHWARRWPVVAPLAVALAALGEGQFALTIVPLGYAMAALSSFTVLVQRQFGRAEALVAGLSLAATPVFVGLAPQLGIDMPELAFATLALLMLQWALESRSGRFALIAGIALGMAVQARPTALALTPAFLAVTMAGGRGRLAWLLILGLMLPQVCEAALFAAMERDPLLPWRLSLAHTAVPSAELLPGVDTRQSPLLNPAFIGGWRRTMGIHVHWTLDALLNLVTDPGIAITLGCAAALLAVERKQLRNPAVRRPLRFLLGLAVAWFGILVYVLAIDPKPRMFLPLAAVAATVFAVLGWRRWPARRALAGVALVLILAKGLAAAWDRPQLTAHTAVVATWIAAEPAGLMVEPRTARFLALVPAVRRLPLQDAAADRMLLIGEGDCPNAAAQANLAGWTTLRSFMPADTDPAPIAWLRRHRLFLGRRTPAALCLLRRVSASPGRAASPRRAASPAPRRS